MAFIRISSAQKLGAIIAISFAFFVAEIAGKLSCGSATEHKILTQMAVGFKTGSLALVADAFHYVSLCDRWYANRC
jgi:Co/Zn/Cd efflux system component